MQQAKRWPVSPHTHTQDAFEDSAQRDTGAPHDLFPTWRASRIRARRVACPSAVLRGRGACRSRLRFVKVQLCAGCARDCAQTPPWPCSSPNTKHIHASSL